MERLNRIITQVNESNPKIRKYVVLVCGPHLPNDIGDYGDMIIQLLSTDNNHMQFTKINTDLNGVPSLDTLINVYDGIIISGSKYDAHSNDKWIPHLRTLIREIYNHNNTKSTHIIKMVGICFGHQIIAHALDGGSSGPNTKTIWELGIKKLHLTNAFYKVFGDIDRQSLNINQCHRDAVSSLPNNAMLLAHSEYTDVEMYCIDQQILGIQGHPEFYKSYMKTLIEHKHKNKSAPKSELDYASQSLVDWSPDNDIFKQLILHFLAI
eukprot:113159_1